MSYNTWAYAYSNPVNGTDPLGMFTCLPEPTCKDWILHALAQLEVTSGDLSQYVVGAFWYLDNYKPGGDSLHVNITGPDRWGVSALNYRIILPSRYVKDGFPIPVENVALFAHELIHQTQTWQQRGSIWGEAQGFVFQAKVREEMGITPSGFFFQILELAFDISSPGFTTTNPYRLGKVRNLLLTPPQPFSLLYLLEPLLPSDYDSSSSMVCSLFGP